MPATKKRPAKQPLAHSKTPALPRKTSAQIARAKKLFSALKKLHPEARCELDYRSPHELLIATILSAQTTDVAVNKATPALFKAFPTPLAFAKASSEQIEPYVKTLGFFRMKAKSVHEAMKAVVERFGGKVPQTMDELLTLRGVARKTANVVLSNAFGINQGVVVDTHVTRLVQRLGLSKETDPKKIELDLMSLFPQKDWGLLSHLLIFHGRRYCKARNDLCHQNPACKEFCSNARTTSKTSSAK
ncbi:MAG TPA: endonuclease III, partial [Phycisphaerales bacterium]|nr:endonuclease III [Phycisphaerales bacterium]